MTSITASASFTAWNEEPGFGPDAPLPRLAHATIAYAYAGEVTAAGSCQYVFSYAASGRGVGVGFERVVGTLGAEPGEVVLRHDVTFSPDGVVVELAIVPDSGTGAFQRTTGSGGYTVSEGHSNWEWTLDVERA